VTASAASATAAARYGRRVALWEDRTEWPLAGLAVAFLAAYAWPILDPHLPPAAKHACDAVNVAVWIVFVVDYVARLVLARRRGHYWLHHLADFAMVALPALRPLRLLRLLMLLKVLNRRAASSLHGRVGMYITGSGLILLFCSSLAVLNAERGHTGATITNFGDAVWWSLVTVATVGYGDEVPVTVGGRLVGVGLMIGGVALLGVVTATFASWLVDKVREVSEAEQAVTKADITELRREIAQLRELLLAPRGDR
jgi:voltage-gated potassium channel